MSVRDYPFMGRFLYLARLLFVAEREHLGPVILNGILIPLLLGYFLIHVGGDNPQRQNYLMANAFTLCMGGSMAQVGYSYLKDCATGRYRLIQSVVPSDLVYIGARVILGAVQTLIVAGLGLVFIGAAQNVAPSLQSALLALALMVAASAALSSFGLFLAACFANFDTGSLALGVGAMLLGLASPVLYDAASLPGPLAYLLALSPYAAVVVQIRKTFAGVPLVAADCVCAFSLSVLWSLAFIGLMIRAQRAKQ